MSHNLYAKIDDREQEEYDRDWAISVKVIRSSEWLPDHLTGAVWEEFTPNQARMYADALAREVGSHRFEEAEDPGAERILNVVEWLRYWSQMGVTVYGDP